MSDSVQPHRRQPTRLPHPWDSPGKNTGVGCHFLLQCMEVKSERSRSVQTTTVLISPVDPLCLFLNFVWTFPSLRWLDNFLTSWWVQTQKAFSRLHSAFWILVFSSGSDTWSTTLLRCWQQQPCYHRVNHWYTQTILDPGSHLFFTFRTVTNKLHEIFSTCYKIGFVSGDIAQLLADISVLHLAKRDTC